MKCVICHGDDIPAKEVLEEIRNGYDVIYIPVKVMTCNTCGERYYDRRTMKMIEQVEEQARINPNNLREVGKVLLYKEATASSPG